MGWVVTFIKAGPPGDNAMVHFPFPFSAHSRWAIPRGTAPMPDSRNSSSSEGWEITGGSVRVGSVLDLIPVTHNMPQPL